MDPWIMPPSMMVLRTYSEAGCPKHKRLALYRKPYFSCFWKQYHVHIFLECFCVYLVSVYTRMQLVLPGFPAHGRFLSSMQSIVSLTWVTLLVILKMFISLWKRSPEDVIRLWKRSTYVDLFTVYLAYSWVSLPGSLASKEVAAEDSGYGTRTGMRGKLWDEGWGDRCHGVDIAPFNAFSHSCQTPSPNYPAFRFTWGTAGSVLPYGGADPMKFPYPLPHIFIGMQWLSYFIGC